MEVDYAIFDTPTIFRQQPDWALPPAKLATLEVRGSTENVIYDMHPEIGTFCRPDMRKIALPDHHTELDAACTWALDGLKRGEFDDKPDDGHPYPCFTAKALTLFDTDGALRAEFNGESWITAPADADREGMKARIDELEDDYWKHLRADNHETMRQIGAEIDRLRRLLTMTGS